MGEDERKRRSFDLALRSAGLGLHHIDDPVALLRRRRNVVDVYTYHPDAVRAGTERIVAGYRADDPASLAEALRAGYGRRVPDTVIGGRRVHAIELAVPFIAADGTVTPRFTEASSLLYVDPETSLPVAQRFPQDESTTFYETYEFLPNDVGHAPLLELGAPPHATVVVHPVGEGSG